MAPRLELQELLVDLLGSSNVYFQPPPTVQMAYPCIIYDRSTRNVQHANNKPYKHKTAYQVTVVDSDPDSTIPDLIADLPLCSYERFYTADNLNHDVFQLFF